MQPDTSRRQIPVTMPCLDAGECDAVMRPLRTGWVTQGPEVAAFEAEFAQMVGAAVGAPYACAVSNCTAALHLALLAVGVRPGDEVITVSHSFIATANSIRYCGATPVFVDIEPGGFNLDPTLLQEAITERTRAILCVHQMGMPCDLRAILDVAHRHNIPVVEDAACAIGSEILMDDAVDAAWTRIGKPHGDIACFSFHPRKLITTGDGGMIVTTNSDWDRRFRLWRQHGMSVPDTLRHHAQQVVFESYECLGFNYRLTDIQAAIGREQLKRLPEIIALRRTLAARYQSLLAVVPGLQMPEEPSWARSNWQSYCVRLPDDCDQQNTMQALLDRGIASRRGIMCAHREPAYAHYDQPWSCAPGSARLAMSEAAQDRCIILPLYIQMSESDQDYVVECLSDVCRLGQKSKPAAA